MATYRLCLLSTGVGAHGKITAVLRLHADTDREALGTARETVNAVLKGHPGLSGFELWEGGRKVGAESGKRERKM